MRMEMPAMQRTSLAELMLGTLPDYDPGTLQAEEPRQPRVKGPLDALVLQNPRTASSGRSGKRFASGFSYFFFSLPVCCCMVISLLKVYRAGNGTASTTSRAAPTRGRTGSRLVRYGRNPFRLSRLQRLGR